MADPTLIGILPSPEYSEALLGGDRFYRPPVAVRWEGKWYDGSPDPAFGIAFGPRLVVLPLLWKGAPVPFGIARAIAVYLSQPTISSEAWEWWAHLIFESTTRGILQFAKELEYDGIGEVVRPRNPVPYH